jgi:hypothetical protein
LHGVTGALKIFIQLALVYLEILRVSVEENKRSFFTKKTNHLFTSGYFGIPFNV